MSTFIKRNDQVEGPFTDREIRERIQRGLITPQSPAWKMGMPEWKTVSELVPIEAPAAPPPLPPASAAPRAGGPPPLPAPGAAPAQSDAAPEISAEEALELLQNVFGKLREPQPDAADRLANLVTRFLDMLHGRLGVVARPNHTFYAYRVVTTAIQRIRLDLLKGASLTAKGEEFVGLAAAYLAWLAVINWRRRGLQISGRVVLEPGGADNTIFFFAERNRDGQMEVYSHDFLEDMHGVLLKPKSMFPCMHGRYYAMESLTLPSPEYLFQFSVHLMQAQSSGGNWPRGEKVGGLDSDFTASRELLVNDLHQDCDLPRDDEALRKLSWWVVFPTYGWDMNDGQDYNMMTVFDQISFKKIVPHDVGIDYLRALLRSQAHEIRSLAAHCLMVYHVPPRDAVEATHYKQSMEWRDWPVALAAMQKYQAKLEKTASDIEAECRGWLAQRPSILSHNTAAINDPDYIALSKLPEDRIAEGLAGLEALRRKYPNDWMLQVLLAAQLMRGPDVARGEAQLRELIKNPPDSCEAHSRLGTMLKRQGRHAESMAIYEDEVRRWPWNFRAVDSCMWLLTEGMTKF
ncbi:MAG: GYF domain-containing protein [Verrucomicrobiota bacterium]|jgi:hypothetical protein